MSDPKTWRTGAASYDGPMGTGGGTVVTQAGQDRAGPRRLGSLIQNSHGGQSLWCPGCPRRFCCRVAATWESSCVVFVSWPPGLVDNAWRTMEVWRGEGEKEKKWIRPLWSLQAAAPSVQVREWIPSNSVAPSFSHIHIHQALNQSSKR